MSRFGVFSLLLVLFLDLGSSSKPGCNGVFCSVASSENENGFREASASDSLLRALIGPFIPGFSSEDTSMRRLHSDDGEGYGKSQLTAKEEEEQKEVDGHGFRHHHHHQHPEASTNAVISPEESEASFRFLTKSSSSKGSSKNSNMFCKYTKALLRRIVEIIRPFFR